MTQVTGFNLYLIRHGESANNALPVLQRVSDPQLTDLGLKQVRQLGQHYRDLDRIDHMLVSPFRRTLQTAQPLRELRGMQAEIWTDLYEVGGCFSGYEPGHYKGEPGMTASEISSEFPGVDIPADIDHTGWYKNRPHETWDMAVPRAKAQAQKLRENFEHKDTVVFCFIHADFKQLLLQNLVPQQQDYHGYDIPNTSVTHICFSEGRASVQSYCRTDHLDSGDISY